MSLDGLWPVLVALLPPAGVGFLFYLIVRSMLEGDRRERLAHSRWLAEQDARDRKETK